MTENERFGLVFAESGSINSGTVELLVFYHSQRRFKFSYLKTTENTPEPRGRKPETIFLRYGTVLLPSLITIPTVSVCWTWSALQRLYDMLILSMRQAIHVDGRQG